MAVEVADADGGGDAEDFEAGVLDTAGGLGEVGGEFGEGGDVEFAEKAAEVDAVESVFFGVGEKGFEVPVGGAEGGDGEFHGCS